MENLIFNFEVKGDNRGSLISLESNKSIPFDLKRVYYIYDTKEDVSRGFHAHKELQQVLVCVSGSCKIILDDGHVKSEYILDKPEKGLFVEKMIWREMHDFSEGCVLMVFASEYYDEEDYIRNYDEFMKKVTL
ncbi:FdtA/QdtA family cupin domain-containing protein [Psychrobacillus sp.]|uniref:sugar 3,4-ketoisomerase n=1 Tax=Psychrobacillus sp. TaxID=1871623 RepID=UPI0028BE5A7B|nr:FdtA/QdtA family cupin domain-containing protein [Psychrobacillus sp.]